MKKKDIIKVLAVGLALSQTLVSFAINLPANQPISSETNAASSETKIILDDKYWYKVKLPGAIELKLDEATQSYKNDFDIFVSGQAPDKLLQIDSYDIDMTGTDGITVESYVGQADKSEKNHVYAYGSGDGDEDLSPEWTAVKSLMTKSVEHVREGEYSGIAKYKFKLIDKQKPQYTITIKSDDGISEIEGVQTFHEGDEVSLVAKLKSEHYLFDAWNGYLKSNSNKISFIMPANDVTFTVSTKYNTNNAVHKFKAVDLKAATCTEAGTKQNKCEDCGYTLPAVMTAPALGHSFTEWESSTGGYACTTSGKKTRECERCHKVETQTIAALGHSYEIEYYYCKTCGKHFDKLVASHTNENGTTCNGTIYTHKTCVYGCGQTADAIASPIGMLSKFNADSANYDIAAKVNGKQVTSTYDTAGYSSKIRVDSSTATMTNGITGGTLNGVKYNRTFSVDEQNRATITYTFINTTNVDKKVGASFDADIQVNGNDKAPITANTKGFTMTGNGVTLQVYAQNTPGVDDADGWWYGHYSSRSGYQWTTSKMTGTTNNTDTGMVVNWQNRTLPANATITFTVKMGLV